MILVSQNRQSEKDRISAEHAYEVNLKAELEIMPLHEKIDLLRETQSAELLGMQNEQLALLAGLIEKKTLTPRRCAAAGAHKGMPARASKLEPEATESHGHVFQSPCLVQARLARVRPCAARRCT
ncbi:MAG: DUF1003 domain-containing protein [Rhizobacter sp.]|nr:DUF1003 domain-containing protein [Rhizobacter sp.]